MHDAVLRSCAVRVAVHYSTPALLLSVHDALISSNLRDIVQQQQLCSQILNTSIDTQTAAVSAEQQLLTTPFPFRQTCASGRTSENTAIQGCCVPLYSSWLSRSCSCLFAARELLCLFEFSAIHVSRPSILVDSALRTHFVFFTLCYAARTFSL